MSPHWWGRGTALALVFTVCQGPALAQHYWVHWRDKGGAGLAPKPVYPLSEAALVRRAAVGLVPDSTDAAIPPRYLARAQQYGTLVGYSRWLNRGLVLTTPGRADSLAQLPEVAKVLPLVPAAATTRRVSEMDELPAGVLPEGSGPFGRTALVAQQLGVNVLHAAGWNGKGQRIAVFDSGFLGVDTLAAFSAMRQEGRLLAATSWVRGIEPYRGGDSHGTETLGLMAANLPEVYVGMAPAASYLLAVVEDERSERNHEELYWLMAAEWADSAGADIISSSLTYDTFDEGYRSYAFSDLNGTTTVVAQAAALAAQKGILVMNAAGNEGQSRWRRIGSPCDAPDIICVGATRADSVAAAFSSYGPAADGRVKPELAALGQGVPVVTPRGRIITSSGTSYSTPAVAGMAACLLQAFPQGTTATQLRRALQLSGHLAESPTPQLGCGIPDATVALELLMRAKQNPGGLIVRQKPGGLHIYVWQPLTGPWRYRVMRGSSVLASGSKPDEIATAYVKLPTGTQNKSPLMVVVEAAGGNGTTRLMQEIRF